MNHTLFEEWLLAQSDPYADPLLPDQTQALQAHLAGCASCQALARGWSGARAALHRPPAAEPAPGFAQRWQARLEAERTRLHRRQTLAALGFVAGGAFLLLASLGLLAAPLLGSPSIVFWAWFSHLLALAHDVSSLGGGLADLLRSLGGALSILAWVILIGLLAELGVLWIVFYRFLTNPRRVHRDA
jgi:hypothetical protein